MQARKTAVSAVAAATGFQIITHDGELAKQELEVSESKWTIDKILEAAGDLAALPHVVLKLIQMTGDISVTAVDLEKVILTDQAVAARVLALANSAYFGLPRRIFFVREAVVFLGFKTVRNLAMTVNAINMFIGRSDTLSLSRSQLWHHSLNVALSSKMVAERLNRTHHLGISSEEAFTAGLLHDIGKMVLDLAMPEEYIEVVKSVSEQGVSFASVEDQYLPFLHGEVGAALALRWNLPVTLCEAIQYHHTPEEATVAPLLVATVSLGNELTDYLSELVDGSQAIEELAPALYSNSCEILGLTVEDLPNLIIDCRDELEKGLALHSCV